MLPYASPNIARLAVTAELTACSAMTQLFEGHEKKRCFFALYPVLASCLPSLSVLPNIATNYSCTTLWKDEESIAIDCSGGSHATLIVEFLSPVAIVK